MRTDAQVQEDVLEELKWNPSITQEHIGVSVSEGIVTLSGKVPTYIEKFEAEKSAQQVLGVKAVVEKIEVEIPGIFHRDDEDIAKSVLDVFRWNSQIPDEKLKVSVNKGWVSLSGEVEWEYQKKAAEDAVRALGGVKGIFNNIEIKPHIHPIDIKSKIEQALKRAVEREAQRIEISVSGTKVTLNGKVRSFADLQAIKGAAWSAPGVTYVDDHLTIAA